MKEAFAECAVVASNQLGEGILWCASLQCLYWTDIESATLWRHHPATGVTDTWPMPERLACLALCESDDWLLLGLASRLVFFHLPTRRIETVCEVEPHLPTRINDGACDREGRFVFGTKHEPRNGEPPERVGSFYRLDPDLSLHRLDLDNIAIANGIAFSPNGRIMYFCDSPTRVIHRCEYDATGCTKSVHRWVDLRGGAGEPDGAAMDADGGLWVALWGAGRVVRFDPKGSKDLTVHVPTRLPSRPTLGGDGLDTLYVTSARDGLTASELRDDPQAGHVFSAAFATQGLPEPRFSGSLPASPLVHSRHEHNRHLSRGTT